MSPNGTKTMKETSKENNKALATFNDEILEKMIDRGILASCLMSLLPKIANLEHSSHFKLVRGCDSIRVKDLLVNKTIPLFYMTICWHSVIQIKSSN